MMKRSTVFVLFLFHLTLGYSQIYNPNHLDVAWRTDTSLHKVDLSEFTVVLPRGAFPHLNYPQQISGEEGRQAFFEHEPVIVVTIDKKVRAYPLSMLTVHEISNDTLAGVPILVTYCPLCNAAVVFDRQVTQSARTQVLDFEVSGMLRNSDMVMFDRQTESWWQQLTGEALVGKLSGASMKVIPSLVISVEEFFSRYPEGEILSRQSGSLRAQRQYGKNPYIHYDAVQGQPYEHFFPTDQLDNRLPPMERVADIRVGEKYKVYPFSIAASRGVINDQFEGVSVVVFHRSGTVSVLDEANIRQSADIGSVTVFNARLEGRLLTFRKENNGFKDDQTQSLWDITGQAVAGPLKGKQLEIMPHSNHFAFAWLAFHPESEIYQPR